jgi:hypothetical protein
MHFTVLETARGTIVNPLVLKLPVVDAHFDAEKTWHPQKSARQNNLNLGSFGQ